MDLNGEKATLNETFVSLPDSTVFVRHNQLRDGRPTMLFIHGIGESGLCWEELNRTGLPDRMNVVVPDLAGYGRSSRAKNYGFDAHIERLWAVLEALKRVHGFAIADLHVVGHSMGGDIGTLLCNADKGKFVRKFVNIEGDLTQFDVFISNQAVEAHQSGDFDLWFDRVFRESKVYRDWGTQYASCRRYYASLSFARREAFLENAQELVRRNTCVDGAFKSEIGELYCNLRVPRVFCYGTISLAPETLEYLKLNRLWHESFEGAFHWPMIDSAPAFYSFLERFLLKAV